MRAKRYQEVSRAPPGHRDAGPAERLATHQVMDDGGEKKFKGIIIGAGSERGHDSQSSPIMHHANTK